jgi:hypothetical protein
MKTEFSPENVDDEEIIDLTEEVTEDGEEIIDLTDGIDEITEGENAAQTALPDLPPPESDSRGVPPPPGGDPEEISIEELTIESLIVEEPQSEPVPPKADVSASSDDTDIFLDLDRLLPDSPPQAETGEGGHKAPVVDTPGGEQDIFLDSLFPEEAAVPQSETLASIGLPVSGEAEAAIAAPEAVPSAETPGDLPDALFAPRPEESLSSVETISEQQVDAALERVIRRMFQEQIATSIHEVVERIVSEEMQRLRALLLDEQPK